MKFQVEGKRKNSLRVDCSCTGRDWAVYVGAESGLCSGFERGSSGTDRGATGGCLSQLHQLDRKRHRSGRSRRCRAWEPLSPG